RRSPRGAAPTARQRPLDAPLGSARETSLGAPRPGAPSVYCPRRGAVHERASQPDAEPLVSHGFDREPGPDVHREVQLDQGPCIGLDFKPTWGPAGPPCHGESVKSDPPDAPASAGPAPPS